MATMMVEALGLLAGVIGIVAWIPQIIQVWVHKRHDGLSLIWNSCQLFCYGRRQYHDIVCNWRSFHRRIARAQKRR